MSSAGAHSLTAETTDTPNFDSLAGVYRWMEWLSFGPWLALCRSNFLPGLGSCRRALVLGDGDGRFTARLLRANPLIEINAVDSSPAMLRALLRSAGPHRRRVQTHVADARAWRTGNGKYDLIVAHFFLDCLSTEEIARLARQLRNCVQPQAQWVISEFDLPENRILRLPARLVIAFLYRAFGWLTGLQTRWLPDYRAALSASGFRLVAQRRWLAGWLISEIWQPDSKPSKTS